MQRFLIRLVLTSCLSACHNFCQPAPEPFDNQVKEEEVVGHPRSFALFDSPARVPRADRFSPMMMALMMIAIMMLMMVILMVTTVIMTIVILRFKDDDNLCLRFYRWGEDEKQVCAT